MALVTTLDLNILQTQKKSCRTAVAEFFYGAEKCIPLMMSRDPEVMRLPQGCQPGTIRINKHKTVPLNPDNTFFYGAWPQTEATADISKTLDKEARQTICYYKIKGKTYYEYELNNQRYIFAHGYNKWFQVQFIKWQYDPETQKAYTEKALWNLDETDDKSLSYFWLQAFQATKKMRAAEKSALSSLERRLKTGENIQLVNNNQIRRQNG